MQTILSEFPSELKQLAKLLVRGFYDIECSLVIDMLVRYHCMRENDLCDILKFDKKFLRCKLATIKADKFVVMKLKIETREDGKAVKMNCFSFDLLGSGAAMSHLMSVRPCQFKS